MILLIGNYPLDRQQSMQRFATMMLAGLTAAGVPAELIQPQARFGRVRILGPFVAKWLAYIDKFIFFPRRLRKELAMHPDLVHICDHSNAMYAAKIHGRPVVVTCHDLLAVRGALGEDTDCPASATGKILQRWIVAGLRKADVIVTDSQATLEDVKRLVGEGNGRPKLKKVTLGLSYPYRKLPPGEAWKRLSESSPLDPQLPFVLHVGSNVAYKNRPGVLRIFAACREQFNRSLVFAGEPLSDSLRSLGRDLGIADRIVELPGVSNELLEALYNCADVLLFPSSAEGFGWPIAEAHACGCPVLCADREPMREVAGGAALTHPVKDETGFAADLLRLTNPEERARWSAKALENAKRFSTERMVTQYIELYRSLGAAA
ncbi:MAG: glycosyltransferase family 1 protein [Verrucomicrobia bacterium]|nr:MAG: glycosyltransferase family 1 protein [Verrucomicrobiota bacterium]